MLRTWILDGLSLASKLDGFGMGLLRVALVIVLLWIGGLKFVDYEADGIVPLVANSPLMRFFYRDPGGYRAHMNREVSKAIQDLGIKGG